MTATARWRVHRHPNGRSWQITTPRGVPFTALPAWATAMQLARALADAEQIQSRIPATTAQLTVIR